MGSAGTITRERVALVALTFVAGGLLSLLISNSVGGQPLIDDMSKAQQPEDGLIDPTRHTSGLYPTEVAPDGTTFRWTAARATLTFPYASHLGRHAEVDVRLAAPRPPGGQAPNVVLLLNSHEVARFAASPDMTSYSTTLDTDRFPNPYLEQSHLQFDIESDTFISPSDGRVLGVMVDEVNVQMEASRTQLALQGLVWASLAALVALVAGVRHGILLTILVSAAALLSFSILAVTYIPRGISPLIEIALAGLAWLTAIMATPRKYPAIAFTLAFVCLWMIVAGRVLGDWQMDDAYISYRYAQNLLQGSGLVYNPGEIVEGYTNFSWTLLAALSLLLGLSPAEVGLAANIALGIGLVTLTYFVARRLWGGSIVPLAASVLVGVDGAVLTYGARGSGMEAIAFSFLLMLAAALIWCSRKIGSPLSLVSAGIVLALAILTRPEGVLVAGIYIAVLWWQLRSEGRYGLKRMTYLVAPLLLVVVPYELWRTTFYGYLFPNTFYAKTGSTTALIERGWVYASVFLGERWLLAGLVVVALVIVLACRRHVQLQGVAAFALLIAAFILYVIWVGGDHFPGWRFLVPLVAPMAVLAAGTVHALINLAATERARALTWAGLLLTLSSYSVSALWLLEPQSVNAELTALHTSYVNRWGSAGLWLRDGAPRNRIASTAAKGAGAIAYYSEKPVIDVYGLNDLHIGHLEMPDMGSRNAGHDKEDPAYVLDRQPEYILDEWLNYFQPVKGRLKEEYEYLVARTPTGPELAWWRRKDAP